jgi:hypothetical protein
MIKLTAFALAAVFTAAFGGTPAKALPSCQALINECKQDCYSRGAINKCPRRCEQKLARTKDGRKFIIWNEFANPDDMRRQDPSKWRRQACA